MSSARTLAVLPLQDALFFVSMLYLQFSHKATVIPLKNYCVFPFELPFHFLKLSTNAYQTATIHKWHQLQKFLQTRGSASLCELVDNCFPYLDTPFHLGMLTFKWSSRRFLPDVTTSLRIVHNIFIEALFVSFIWLFSRGVSIPPWIFCLHGLHIDQCVSFCRYVLL